MKAIFCDAGHGLTPTGAPDSGAVGNGTTERIQVKAFAKLLMARLSVLPFQIIGVSVDEDLSIQDHVKEVESLCKQNGWGPNDALLVSLHMNAGDVTASGAEAWYGTGKPSVLAQAVVEAFSTASGIPLRSPAVKPSSEDRLGRLAILDDTTPTSALLECGFVTNASDTNIIETRRPAIVEGIALGICNFLSIPLPAMPLPTTFSDVPTDAWFHDAAYTCLQQGIVEMPADRLFHPEQPVNRAQMAVMLARLLRSLQK